MKYLILFLLIVALLGLIHYFRTTRKQSSRDRRNGDGGSTGDSGGHASSHCGSHDSGCDGGGDGGGGD